MSILSLLFTLIVVAFILFISGVGIVFFGEWALIVLKEMTHQKEMKHQIS